MQNEDHPAEALVDLLCALSGDESHPRTLFVLKNHRLLQDVIAR